MSSRVTNRNLPGSGNVTTRVRDRAANLPATRARVFKVNAPRDPGNPDTFARFVADLNRQFGLVSDELTRVQKSVAASQRDLVSRDDLPDAIAAQADQTETLTTSEVAGSEGGASTTSTSPTSQQSGGSGSDPTTSAAAIENAKPTSPPPNVAAASAIGTTSNPIQFSYADHTHGGVAVSGGGSGTAGQVAFFTSAFEIKSDADFLWDNTNKFMSLVNASLVRSFDVGNPTVPTESYLLFAEQATVSGTNQITLQGTAVLRGV